MANYTTPQRPQWGGANSTLDQHIELYDGVVETGFNYQAIFTRMSTQRSTTNKSNNIRIDQLAGSTVKYRKANDNIVEQRSPSDKVNVYVECMTYVRNVIDWMDNWTAPDFWVELGQNAATAFAQEYDQSHIILLQKAADYVAPAHLKVGGAFFDGLYTSATIAANPTTEAAIAANAEALYKAHGAIVTALVKRRVPMQDMVTLVNPDIYDTLIHHPKLINKDYVANNGDFAGRRVVMANGLPIVESTAFPAAGVAITGHGLSTTTNNNAFDATATQTTGEMIVFSKTKSLVTVTAQGWSKSAYPVEEKMADHLDHYAMWSAAVRRADTVGVVRVTRAP